MRSILGAVALAGCGSLAAPDRDVDAPMQTERLKYTLTETEITGFFSTGPIRIELTNTSGQLAFTDWGSVGPELVLERLENSEWVETYAKPIGGVGPIVQPLEPGRSVVFQTSVEGARPGECDCSLILDFEDGIYRFRILDGYFASYDPATGGTGDPLPPEFRVSNAFALDLP